MSKKPVFYMLFFTGLILLAILIMQPLTIFHFQNYIDILFPNGPIAIKERNLLFIIQGLMLLIIIPVYILTFVFSWKYRADNPKGVYDPDLVDNKLAEVIWWGVPLIMTVIVSILTWVRTHQLDPYKPIESPNKEITIQVVALQWRWLFIYPEEKIASLNFVHIPKDTPIHFEITADAPMNSFWIPDLGGQIYAMPKMKTELYLMASELGRFHGYSANLSGEGFSKMHFETLSSTKEDYQKWIEKAQASSKNLDFKTYEKMAAPSMESLVETFQLKEPTLFTKILHKYMHKSHGT